VGIIDERLGVSIVDLKALPAQPQKTSHTEIRTLPCWQQRSRSSSGKFAGLLRDNAARNESALRWSRQAIEKWVPRGKSVRMSARSTPVERALRARLAC